MKHNYTPTQIDILTALENRGYSIEQALTAIQSIKAGALRDAAYNLHSRPWTVYKHNSGKDSDNWGNDELSIDKWYVEYLQERADRIEKRGVSK